MNNLKYIYLKIHNVLKYMSNYLTAIEINSNQKRLTILLNVLKMLSARGYIKKDNINKKYDTIKDKLTDELVFNIETDVKKKYNLKFVPHKITTINKAVGLSDFLTSNKNSYNIIIVDDINKKAYKQIMEYPDTEVFWNFEFMFNLIDHQYIPQHEVLPLGYHPPHFDVDNKYNNHEKFEDTYLVTKRECPKMEVTDPVARYYKLVPGQYVRIKRESIMSGYAPTYRIVVQSPLSKLFERF